MEMFACVLGCIFLFNFMTQSASICVQEYGSGSSCSNSSLLLVPNSQIQENNGYSILVKGLPTASSSGTCGTCDAPPSKSVTATIGDKSPTSLHPMDTTVQVNISRDIGNGAHTILLSYTADKFFTCTCNCDIGQLCTGSTHFGFSHEITLKVFDNPVLYYNKNSDILECQISYTLSDALTEFKLNDEVLGYCAQYTNRVEDKAKGISIYYDPSSSVCTLKIDQLSDVNEGSYSCSVIVPYPDGNGFLKLNSTSVTLRLSSTTTPTPQPSSNGNTIGITLGIIVPVVVLIILISGIVFILLCRSKEWCCFSKPDYNNIGYNNDGTKS